jgi:hypothetical protein
MRFNSRLHPSTARDWTARARRSAKLVAVVPPLALCLVACGQGSGTQNTDGPLGATSSASSAVSTATLPSSAASVTAAVSTPKPPVTGSASTAAGSSTPTGTLPTAGIPSATSSATLPVGSSTAPSATGSAAPSSGTTPAPATSSSVKPPEGELDHCLYGYNALPNDATMKAGPSIVGGDTVVQPEVLDWMAENKWTGAHVVWHAVRGCTDGSAGGLLAPLGFPNICKDYPFLIPTDQNCKTAGDGYQFLLFHRHMLESLKQLWPTHAEDFDGFEKFPTTAEELPETWKSKINWNSTILGAAEIGDNIEDHLDLFPDEGALGYWLQCPGGSRKLAEAPNMPYIGLHFDLHNQWSAGPSSPHGLNNGQVNITNYMFWKLHGWIDKVWEKYRVAKGLTEDPMAMQKYKTDLTASCREMDTEIEILKQPPNQPPVFDCPPEADETGDFHTKVRPIFESSTNNCASCHGPAQNSPYADLTLGGAISSKCLVEKLKRTSINGGQFKLIEPGDPSKSWLYLKAAGTAVMAGCVDGSNPCNTAVMPPGGKTLTDAELKVLSDWITAGAN